MYMYGLRHQHCQLSTIILYNVIKQIFNGCDMSLLKVNLINCKVNKMIKHKMDFI